MLAKETYDATAIGSEGTMSCAPMVSVGVAADDSGYQRFAEHVAALEDMETRGLVAITYRHHESKTGRRYVDLVRFKRLA